MDRINCQPGELVEITDALESQIGPDTRVTDCGEALLITNPGNARSVAFFENARTCPCCKAAVKIAVNAPTTFGRSVCAKCESHQEPGGKNCQRPGEK